MMLHKFQRQRSPHHLVHKQSNSLPRTSLVPGEQGWVCKQSPRGHKPPKLGQIRPLFVTVSGREVRRGVRQGAHGEDVSRHQDRDFVAVLIRQELQSVEIDRQSGRRAACPRVYGEEVDVPVMLVAKDCVDEVDCLPGAQQIFSASNKLPRPRNATYRRSLWTRIFTLTLRPLGLSISRSFSTAHPSSRSLCRVSSTRSRTSARSSMSAAPSVSAHAQDCGQPQLRSTPPTYGATREEARASSWGTLAPNWTIVGGWGPRVAIVKSIGNR